MVSYYSVEQNIYDMSEEELKKHSISSLPGSLYDAICEMQNDELVKQTLGKHIFDNYVKAKLAEWDEYRSSVSQWEIDKYLPTY